MSRSPMAARRPNGASMTCLSGTEPAARIAAVRGGIDELLERVAELRAIRLRQLAAVRSGSRARADRRARARSKPAN